LDVLLSVRSTQLKNLAKQDRGACPRVRVADIVQCGPGVHNIRRINGLGAVVGQTRRCKLLILLMLQGWLAALDDFRNWLIREAA
jgi:hypothetical protein